MIDIMPKLLSISFEKIPLSIPVAIIDGSNLKDGDITHCTVPVRIKTCLGSERLRFFVIQTKDHTVILGAPWLVKHNPDIDWCDSQVSPRPLYCPVKSMLPTLTSLV